jgi:glycosyltransferase involved in cell wall biosynthesis
MPRFSLIVTTTDRPSLLPASIRSALEIDFGDFEILVSDNYSRIPASEILADLKDPRVRIIRTDCRLPLADHWEFAWKHVRGEYAMNLGDDNALHPGILTFADRAIRQHDLDVLSWRVCAYFHPDWDVVYGPLPNQGNVLGIDNGTTGQLYHCDAAAVIKHFCRELRLSGCFPCMLNLLFRKASADLVRERAGRFYWAPCADISSSYFLLGVTQPGRYAFYDAFGAIGGRSRDSNLASALSKGKSSRRYQEYVGEYQGQELLPYHEPKFNSVTNTLAAPISQAKALMPEYFAAHDFDGRTLARRTIEDMYVDRTVPWYDDPHYTADVEQFIASLPLSDAAEIEAYRDGCRARMRRVDSGDEAPPNYVRNSRDAHIPLIKFLRSGNLKDIAFAWRLLRQTGRNPLGKYWVSGGTTYVDMGLFGSRDIADAARALPRVLENFDRHDDAFVKYYRGLSILGEALTGARPDSSLAVGSEETAEVR